MYRLKQLVLETFNGVLPSELIDSRNKNAELEILKNLPFHLYWKSKKYFRLQLPTGFHKKAFIVISDQRRDTGDVHERNKLILQRWNGKLHCATKIPLFDSEIQFDSKENDDALEEGEVRTL